MILAAPMMIVQKAIQTGNELRIVLYKSAREIDISTFFRLSITIDGNRNIIAGLIGEKAEVDGTLFSYALGKVREKKEAVLILQSATRITSLEISDGEKTRYLAVE